MSRAPIHSKAIYGALLEKSCRFPHISEFKTTYMLCFDSSMGQPFTAYNCCMQCTQEEEELQQCQYLYPSIPFKSVTILIDPSLVFTPRPSPRPSPGLGPSPRPTPSPGHGRGDTTPPLLHLWDLQLSSDSLPGLDWGAGGGGAGAGGYSPHHHKVSKQKRGIFNQHY